MAKRGNLILLALAMVLALVTTLLVMRFLQSNQRSSTPTVVMKSVVVVKKGLSTHQPISSDDVVLQQVPAGGVEPGAATSLSQVIGQYTTTTFIQGQQVVQGMYAAGSAVMFSASIPQGERAFTISDSPVVGVDHLIVPGDHVDVMVLQSSSNKNAAPKTTTMNDLQVLFVDQIQPAADPANPKSPSSGGDTITFAVTPQQAQQLAQLETQGQLYLLLRNPSQKP